MRTTDAEELHAFAKLYGYVRFFHPSDEVVAADWDRIAVDGARRVVGGETRDELEAALIEIFRPVARTLVVVAEDEPLPPAAKLEDGPVLAWQHAGYGFGFEIGPYASRRRRATASPRGCNRSWR